MNPGSPDRFILTYRSVIERLYSESGATRWKLSESDFAAALERSFARRFGDGIEPDSSSGTAFLQSLHVHDLALATACLAGNQDAWATFIKEFRPAAGAIARSLINDPSRAGEAADSIWADLYGVREVEQENRKSPLVHYHGRSSLKAWLRVVIARRQVDEWRAARPAAESLDAHDNGFREGAAACVSDDDPDRARLIGALGCALNAAIAALVPRDKLRLSYYYVQELTLAEVATMLGEHESTVSRKIAAARVEIRHAVEGTLRQEHGLSNDQINRCFEFAVEDWPFELGRVLSQTK
jgi:RNA polymerase sigma-70 factor